MFDPKPELQKLAGKDVPQSLAANVPKINRSGLKNLMASHWSFDRYGECEMPISSLLPEMANCADDLCLIRSMTHRNPVHGPAECVALTGASSGRRPSLGAWSIYGLGSLNEQLPAYIGMNIHSDGMQFPQASGWGCGFLPSRFQGTIVDPSRGIRNVGMPKGMSVDRRRSELEAIATLNEGFLDRVQYHSELEARRRSFELAFQLQTAGPELFDLSSESQKIQAAYGLDEKETKEVGRGCLMARRMVERGVRFVQLRVGGWDAHSNIKSNHEQLSKRTDKPIASLLRDLKQRGLLDSTLVVWGGEFGRTPTMEGRGNGRDHSPAAYSIWLSGGGVRGGLTIGETDALGYTVTDRPVKPQDLHATILHALGVDASQLLFNDHGLMESPLGVSGGGPVLEAFS